MAANQSKLIHHSLYIASIHKCIDVSMCVTDHKFSMYTPSMISAASVAAALHGLDWTSKNNMPLSDLLHTLQRILSIEMVRPSQHKETRYWFGVRKSIHFVFKSVIETRICNFVVWKWSSRPTWGMCILTDIFWKKG